MERERLSQEEVKPENLTGYPRDAIKAWCIQPDATAGQRALLRDMLAANHDVLLEDWAKLCELASASFQPNGDPCAQCGGRLRLYQMGPRYEHAIWQCDGCHALYLALDTDRLSPLGATSLTPLHESSPDLIADPRLLALDEWIADTQLDDKEFVEIASMWFLSRDNFEQWWRACREVAALQYPPPSKCPKCESPLAFWRLTAGDAGAIWACDACGHRERTEDNWLKVEESLRELGATPEQLAQVQRAVREEGVSPNEAALHVIQFNIETHAREAMPPPAKCIRCGETEWALEEVSPNSVEAKWKCSFCGRR